MKEKFLLIILVLFMILCMPNIVFAEVSIVKDVEIVAQGESVKISITANQPLQIETFKSEDGNSNYLVLDFLGRVYTALPAMVSVESLVVEKVNLVRGEDQPVTIDGMEYYILDFLAVNLNPEADYKLNQTQAVIDLNISMGGGEGMGEGRAVDLEPPIVVATKKILAKKTEYKYTPSYATDYGIEKKVESNNVEKKKKKRGFLWFGKKKHSRDLEREIIEKKEPGYRQNDNSKNTYLIDKVVKDTIREKEQTNSKIENLTFELQRMQKELNMSKGQKFNLESKISEILSKLDSLNDALEEEIRRRKALGEQVDDLQTKKRIYLETKKKYEEISSKLSFKNDKVNNMNIKMDNLHRNLQSVNIEKKNLEEAAGLKRQEFSQINAEYEETARLNRSVSEKASELKIKLDQVQKMLNQVLKEKEMFSAELKGLEAKRNFIKADSDKLKEKLSDRVIVVEELEARNSILSREIEMAISEKEKLDRDYQTAKIDYEKIRREIESFIKN